MPNTRIASSPTRVTDAIGNKRSDQHDHLQRLLVEKEVEVEHYRDRAEEAEHKLELVTVSRRFQCLLFLGYAGAADATAATEIDRLTSLPVGATARDAHPCVSSRSSAAANNPRFPANGCDVFSHYSIHTTCMLRTLRVLREVLFQTGGAQGGTKHVPYHRYTQ